MSFDKKYELVEVLRDDGVKTFRARESATGRLVELHVLVGQPGKSEPPFDLLEKVRKLPPEQQTSIVETGEHMGTPYIVTLPITDAANFREWVAARVAAAPKAAYDPLRRVGHWKVPRASGEPPTVTPMSLELHPPTPRTQKNPTLKSAETAPDITVVFNTAELMIGQQSKTAPAAPPPPPTPQPSADITSVFHAQTFTGSPAFPAPPPPTTPAPSKDSDFEFTRMFDTGQGKAAPSAEPGASGPGGFTQMFQVPPAAAEKKPTPPPPPTQAPPAMPPPPSMPPPAAGGPLPVTAAKKQPGEFTRMFQAKAAPASDAPSSVGSLSKPSPEVPAPAEAASSTTGGPGEFTRMFRAQSTPADSVAPASTPTPAPSMDAPPAMPPPQPLSPGATASPDVTSLFQTGSTPVVSPLPTKKSSDKASDTAQFPAVSGTAAVPPAASTSGKVSFPSAPPAGTSPLGDFTSMFQTGQSPTPAAPSGPPLPQTLQSPVPAAPPPDAGAAGEFTSIFKTGGMPAATPQAQPAAGPASQAPGEFTNIFQTGCATPSMSPPPQQQPKPSASAPPAAPTPPAKPGQDLGEFTRIFAASPGQPIGEAGTSAQQSKLPSPSPSAPSGFGAPAGGGASQDPGEFTRVFSTPMAAPKSPLPMAGPPQTAFSDPNPFAAPSSPLPRPMVQPQPGNASPFGQAQSPFGQSLPPLPQTPQMGQPQGGMIPPRPFAAPAQPSIKDEYQQMFGGGDRSMNPQQQPMSPMGNSPGVPGGGGGFGTATQSFQAFSGAPGQAPQAGGPSEYTRMFNAPSSAAPPTAPAAAAAAAAPKGLMAKKWPIFVFAGILLLLIIGAIIMFVLK